MRTIRPEKSGKALGYVGIGAALAISAFASMTALLSNGVIDTKTPVGGSARVVQQPDDQLTTGSIASRAAPPSSASVASAEPNFPLGPPVVRQAPEAEQAKQQARSVEDSPRAAESSRARTRAARYRDRDVGDAFGRLHAVR